MHVIKKTRAITPKVPLINCCMETLDRELPHYKKHSLLQDFLKVLPTANTVVAVDRIRVATFNTSLYSDQAGGLIQRLQRGDASARKIAAVIQHQRPDLLLLNEFDYDAEGRAADLFQKCYLGKAQFGQKPITYKYRYFAPVNTGVPSGFDLNGDGKTEGGNDAFGFGNHPGQYGMLVLSKFPMDKRAVRTFQKFLWKDMPQARIPLHADGSPWYSEAAWNAFRLSSKSHWDIPVATPMGTLHILASHPTPPVFDGPEDRNGKRNADEIRFWGEYVWNRGNDWIVDDLGQRGDFELAIKRRIGRAQLRQAFLGAQGLKLGKREIFGEPAGHFMTINGLACLAVGKFGLVGNVGGFRNLILVPRDQHAVFRQHKVRLNIIRALFNRAGVACDGVFGPLTRCAAMRDDDGLAV